MYESYDASTISIVNDYIKTITFVDDEIVFNDEVADENKINANLLMKIFASKGKFTTFLQYKNHSEKDNILKLLVQSDTCVIDWYLKINAVDGGECDPDEDEDDVEIQAVRGPYAIELIKDLIERNDGRLKLIVIYTAEIDAVGITKALCEGLNTFGLDVIKHEECLLEVCDIKISVLFKPTIKVHSENDIVSKRIVEYVDLPEVIVKELSFFTQGLLSNTIMESINILRNSTGKLLSTFHKDLDAAFLAHRALLPNGDDANNLLFEAILGAIRSIFYYSGVINLNNIHHISEYIKKTLKYNHHFNIDEVDTQSFLRDNLILIQKLGYLGFFGEVGISSSKIKKIEKDFHNKVHAYYLKTPDPESKISEEFSILTHHKSIFKAENTVPKLSLGTVIQGVVSGEYLVCIQQSCDSVRIKPEESRRFIFLPLKNQQDKKNIDVVTREGGEYLYFKVDYSNSFKLRTIKFSTNTGYILAVWDGSNFIFEPDYSSGDFDPAQEKFRWSFDLKDLHAQRILNEFASKMSRVGLDESEWLRKS